MTYISTNLIWTVGPQIFSAGVFQFRWYTVLLLAGILLVRWLFLKKVSGLAGSGNGWDGWFIRAVAVSVILARLVHVLLFQPYLFRLKPLQVLLPFDFSGGFRFLGTEGFSAWGALAGLMLVIWWASRRSGVSFRQLSGLVLPLWLLLMGFVRLGDFLNSEGYGRATESPAGVVFARPELNGLMKVPCCVMRTPDGENPLVKVHAVKGVTLVHQKTGFRPVIMYLWFKPDINEQVAQEFIIGDVKGYLFDHPDHFYEPGDEPIHYTLFQEKDGSFIGRIQTIGVARHPLAIYEMCFFLLAFFSLMRLRQLPLEARGGWALVILSLGQFLFGFLSFVEKPLIGPLSTVQLTALVFLLIGAAMVAASRRTRLVG